MLVIRVCCGFDCGCEEYGVRVFVWDFVLV